MYEIGNLIVGTYLPWDDTAAKDIAVAYAATDPEPFLHDDAYENAEAVMAAAENGELEWLDMLEDVPWKKEYHGAAPSAVAWVGESVGSFDVTDHMPASKISKLIAKGYDPDVILRAMERYELLPMSVREILPPFGVYIVWSSS